MQPPTFRSKAFQVPFALWIPLPVRLSTVDFLDLDLDLLELGGQVSWAEPLDLSKVQDYVVYLGNSIDRSQLGVAQNSQLDIRAETPTGRFESLLVYTRSSLAEQSSPSSLIFQDNEVLLNISFYDLDLDEGDLGGLANWSGTSEELVLEYAVYLAEICEGQERNDTSDTSDVATWENSTSPDFCNLRYIDTVNASEPRVQIPAETPKMNSTHLAVFARSALVEQRTPSALLFFDASASVTQLSFADLDLDVGQLGGSITWQAADTAAAPRVLSYDVYLAPDTAATQRSRMGSQPVGQEALVVEPETDLFEFSYIVVFTRSALTEQTTPVGLHVSDTQATVENVSFIDLDLDFTDAWGNLD
ncbi:unnamed protein product [Durusdinium trenchii]|uniref:Uncharacterized protein n=1 Tax=Durusdinium trenchii TaxID=1381693 RepID=A0ABP0SRD9_9DINO